MAGSLIKIDEEIVTSAVASVTLGGSDWDSSYDVYMVKYNNYKPATDTQVFKFRFTEGGTPNTTANYDMAHKVFTADTAFGDMYYTNQTFIRGLTLGNQTGENANGILYLFNMNSTTEYAFCTLETTTLGSNSQNNGAQGGGVLTVTGTARDGIQFFFDSGNIDSGTFRLYGLKK